MAEHTSGAPGVLRASFVRVPGQRDRVYVRRSDGTEASWLFPNYGAGLPHDMVHLIVESAFGLRHGFWGRVDAGVDVARINEEASRSGGRDKYRGFGDELGELMLAEALAGAPWSNPEQTDAAVLDAIERNWVQMDVPRPEGLDPARVVEARRVVLRFAARWRAFEGKGSIVVDFRPEDPRRGFVEMEQG